MGSLIVGDDFQHILRVLNTNVDGRTKVMYALTQIRGIGRRFANVVCKKAEIDMGKRAGELSAAELESLMVIVANPRQFRIPDWFLNRQKDYKDGKYVQLTSNALDTKLRDDLERLKKIRNHRGLRHYWGIRVRGQHTKTTGRRKASSRGARRGPGPPRCAAWAERTLRTGSTTGVGGCEGAIDRLSARRGRARMGLCGRGSRPRLSRRANGWNSGGRNEAVAIA
eukprot:14978-Pelagococcus_subviridis.AAC.4